MTQHDGGTAIASYGPAFVSALNKYELDPAVVFKQAGVLLRASSDPLARISNEDVAKLFQASIRASGDPYFGIAVGSRMQPVNLHAVGFGLLASSSIRDFYQRISNYYRVVSQNADFVNYDDGDASVLMATHIKESTCLESEDAFAVMIVDFLRRLSEDNLNPIWVELHRPCPSQGEQPFLDFFRCPVKFDCADIRIAMDRKIVDAPLPGGSKELAQSNDDIAMRYLEKLDRYDMVNRVRRIIIEDLMSGTLTKQRTADRLHMSPRNLQLKLTEQDTTFQEILDQTRHKLAKGYIEQSRMSITEIAYILGFSDAANFTRAFKRWTNHSPSHYRTMLLSGLQTGDKS
jgi:AraC-like DNA-binding protein